MLEDTAHYATRSRYTFGVPSRAWARWKRFAHRAAEIQSLVVLAILYWVVVLPIGLLRGRRRGGHVQPQWKVRAPAGPVTIEEARRQS
jgi:hypothetical protein